MELFPLLFLPTRTTIIGSSFSSMFECALKFFIKIRIIIETAPFEVIMAQRFKEIAPVAFAPLSRSRQRRFGDFTALHPEEHEYPPDVEQGDKLNAKYDVLSGH